MNYFIFPSGNIFPSLAFDDWVKLGRVGVVGSIQMQENNSLGLGSKWDIGKGIGYE